MSGQHMSMSLFSCDTAPLFVQNVSPTVFLWSGNSLSMPRKARQARLQLDKLLSAFSIITINSDHSNILWKHSILLGQHFSSYFPPVQFSSVQSLSRVQLSATPWTEARQASLSITNSQSLLKLMSIESVMHPTISSSVVPFSSCLQSFPALGSFQMSQLVSSGGQSVGASPSTSVLPMNIQGWFPLGWMGWISLQS